MDIFDVITTRTTTFEEYLESIKDIKDINRKGWCTSCSLLQAAVSNYRVDIATDLIENRGIDVNIQDENGNTVLSYFRRNIDIELINKILSKNADVNIKDNYGNTILWKLITGTNPSEEFYEFIELLLDKGADVSSDCNNSDMSAIDFAVLRKDERLMNLLMKYK